MKRLDNFWHELTTTGKPLHGVSDAGVIITEMKPCVANHLTYAERIMFKQHDNICTSAAVVCACAKSSHL